MASTFSFQADTLVTQSYLSLNQLTTGPGPGVNDPSQWSSVAPDQAIDFEGDVDVFAVTLIAGQTYTFDIDGGAGDASGGSVDLELDLIDQRGAFVLGDDGSTSLDSGSVSTLDPNVTVTVNRTGTYFIAVHSQNDEYIDGFFDFETPGGGTGDYSLVVSTPSLPPVTTLTGGNDSRSFTDAAQNVQALSGNDVLFLNGGNDIAQGGLGSDTLYGGAGDDELAGFAGVDELQGGDGADVLIGGTERDVLNGGNGNDALNGGTGNDDLVGGVGDDTLWGDTGNDVIQGGSGNDFIRGGAGTDTLDGSGGADTFHFLRGESAFNASTTATEDRIDNFFADDAIDLSDLVLGTLTFRGSAAFTGVNQVRVVDLRDDAGNGYQEVRVNLDANTATTELAFLVDTDLTTGGSFTLNASDFIL